MPASPRTHSLELRPSVMLVAEYGTYLRKGKNPAQQLERGVRICERNSPADTEVRAEEGQEVLRTLELRFPCSLRRSPW